MTDTATRAPGAFAPAEHPYVGTARAYLPNGFTPYAPATDADPADGAVILSSGDTVDVLSAWTRPYLDGTAPVLFYVRSRATGEATHVTAADLPLGDRRPTVCDAAGCWGAPFAVTNRGWLTCEAHRPDRDRYTSSRKLTAAERRSLAATGNLK